MPDRQIMRETLQSIIDSPTFKDAYRLKDLLSYLVEETIAGRKPKEAAIAMDVLGKAKDFDSKDDAIVRVYVNNLRNKLEHHYLVSSDPASGYRIHIPKGSYNVEFIPVSAIPKPPRNTLVYVLSGIIAVLLLIVVYLLIANGGTSGRSVQGTTVLSSFATGNKKPVLLVAGDFFFMNEEQVPGGEHYNVRDFKINSTDEFWTEAKKNPGFSKRFTPGLYTYLRPASLWAAIKMLPPLHAAGKEVQIKLASQLTADDMKQFNVIYAGQVKSLFTLQKFLPLFGMKCDKSENTVTLTFPRDSAYKLSPINLFGGKYELDHSLIVRGKGPEGTDILLLMGFAEIGVLGAVEAICEPGRSAEIYQKLGALSGESDENFVSIFRSEGLNQTVFSSKLNLIISQKPEIKVWEKAGK